MSVIPLLPLLFSFGMQRSRLSLLGVMIRHMIMDKASRLVRI